MTTGLAVRSRAAASCSRSLRKRSASAMRSIAAAEDAGDRVGEREVLRVNGRSVPATPERPDEPPGAGQRHLDDMLDTVHPVGAAIDLRPAPIRGGHQCAVVGGAAVLERVGAHRIDVPRIAIVGRQERVADVHRHGGARLEQVVAVDRGVHHAPEAGHEYALEPVEARCAGERTREADEVSIHRPQRGRSMRWPSIPGSWVALLRTPREQPPADEPEPVVQAEADERDRDDGDVHRRRVERAVGDGHQVSEPVRPGDHLAQEDADDRAEQADPRAGEDRRRARPGSAPSAGSPWRLEPSAAADHSNSRRHLRRPRRGREQRSGRAPRRSRARPSTPSRARTRSASSGRARSSAREQERRRRGRSARRTGARTRSACRARRPATNASAEGEHDAAERDEHLVREPVGLRTARRARRGAGGGVTNSLPSTSSRRAATTRHEQREG